MSRLDGDALLPIIRAWKPHIIVSLISVSIHPYIQQKCIDRGDSSFNSKPFAKTDSDYQQFLLAWGHSQVPHWLKYKSKKGN
jgi:hypothetical protein